MPTEKKVGNGTVRLVHNDITEADVDAFVHYANSDLQLGSGYGNAISMRGGPTIQDELKKLGTLGTGEAVTTSAGELKAKHIIHAVGPRFQEEDIEAKLRKTIISALEQAEEKSVERLAFPPMGTGFYGIPLDVSARVTLETIKEHLGGESRIKEVLICLKDSRDLKPFQTGLDMLE